MPQLYNKHELIALIADIGKRGWHKSVKRTVNMRNDGAIGNTLEALLGLQENNLPIPNTQEWELKGQRLHSTSLVTLKHLEPSPQGAKIVSNCLLPYYGWPHKLAGDKYPETERSFRCTVSSGTYTNRGFTLLLDREQNKLRFIFDASKADAQNPEVQAWLKNLEETVGLGPLDPEPYWGLDDLRYAIGSKIRNCFYVIADTRIEQGHEYFRFVKLLVLSRFSFENFLDCLETGVVLVDFDARTGHNHGTKFRIKQGYWHKLYDSIEEIDLTH